VTDRVVGVLGAGLVDPAMPVLRADDVGALRGDGCFETIRVRDAPAGVLDAFDEHLARLARSATALELPLPAERAWRALVAEMLTGWQQPGEAVLRLVLTRGVEGAGGVPAPTGYAVLSPVPAEILRQRREGVRVLTLSRGMPADAHAGAPWLLGGVKATSYAVNMAALRHAQAAGADDVIFVSTDGQILEGPTATVLWLADGVLRSPPARALGILPGITVRSVFNRVAAEGVGTEIARATVADLRSAAGVWLVSSVRLAVAVAAIDGVRRAVPAEWTRRIQAWAGLSAA
jgi:4-amino-4-deoxychorismate lyase